MAKREVKVDIRAEVLGQEKVASLSKALGALKNSVVPAQKSLDDLRAAASRMAANSKATTAELRGSLAVLENVRDHVARGSKEYTELGRVISDVTKRLKPQSDSLSRATERTRAHTKAVRDLTIAQKNAAAASAAAVDFQARFSSYLHGGRGQLARRQMMMANQGTPGGADFMRAAGIYPQGARTSGELNRTLALPAAGESSYKGAYRKGQTTFNIPNERGGREYRRAGQTYYGYTGGRSLAGREYNLAVQGLKSEEVAARTASGQGPASPWPRKTVTPGEVDLTGYKNQLNESRQAVQGFAREQRKAAASNAQMQITADDVVKEINQLGKSSKQTVDSISFQRNELEKISRTLDVNSKAYKKTRRQIELYDKTLEKGTRSRGQRGQQISSVVGTALAAGVFGGAEGFLGGAIGGGLELAGIMGPGAAITGAAVGATLGQARKVIAETATLSAEVSRLELALRDLTTTGVSAEEGQISFSNALDTVRKAAVEANAPIVQATKSYTRLLAAVKGAGGADEVGALAFESINAAVKATGGTAEDAAGALLAASQVFSKGRVSAEELQGQTAERISGAVTLFAEANYGGDLQELQKNLRLGTVGLNEYVRFLQLLDEKFTGTAYKMAASTEEAGARMTAAMESAKVAIGRSIGPIGAELQDLNTNAIVKTTDALQALGLIEDTVFGSDLERRIFNTKNEVIALNKELDQLTKPERAKSQERVNNVLLDFISGTNVKAARMAVQTYRDLAELRSGGLGGKVDKLIEGSKIEDGDDALETYKQRMAALKGLRGALSSVEAAVAEDNNYTAKKAKGNIDKLSAAIARLKEETKVMTAANRELMLMFPGAEREKDLVGDSDVKAKKAAEQVADVQKMAEESLKNIRKSTEREIANIRKSEFRAIERLEEGLKEKIIQGERALQELRLRGVRAREDSEIRLRELQDPEGSNYALEREVLQLKRQFEDERKQIEQQFNDEERVLAKELANIAKNTQMQIMEANANQVERESEARQKSAEKIRKILKEGVIERNQLEEAFYEKYLGRANREWFNKIREGKGKSPIPEPTVRSGGGLVYGGTASQEDIDKMREYDQKRLKGEKIIENLLGGLPKDVGDEIAISVARPVSELITAIAPGPNANARQAQRATRLEALDKERMLALARLLTEAMSRGDVLRGAVEDSDRSLRRYRQVDTLQGARQRREEGFKFDLGEQKTEATSSANEDKTLLLKEAALIQTTEKRKEVEEAINRLHDERLMKIDNNYNTTLKMNAELENTKFAQEEINRLNERNAELANGIANAIGNGMGQAMDALIEGTDNWGESLREIGATVLKDIAKQIMQIMVIKPLVESMSGGLGSLFGVPKGSAMGNAFAGNKIVPYAKGGIVNSPTFFRYKNGGILESGVAGEAGPEGILPLKRGKGGRLGVETSGSGPTVINVNVDATGSKVSGDDPKANQLGRFIAKAVNQEIIKQKRAGGLLA